MKFISICPYPPKDYVFWVGRPNFQLYYLTNSFYYGVEQGPGGGFEVKPFTLVDMRPAFDTQLADVLEYEWQFAGDYYSVISSSNEVMSFISTSNLNSQVYVYLRMRNAAGWSDRPFASIYTRDEGYEPELIYPSPAENELTVQSYEVDEGMNQSRELNFVPATIRILNSNGTQVIEVKEADPVEKIDVSRLEKGYYIVQIIKGDKVSSRKIQIK